MRCVRGGGLAARGAALCGGGGGRCGRASVLVGWAVGRRRALALTPLSSPTVLLLGPVCAQLFGGACGARSCGRALSAAEAAMLASSLASSAAALLPPPWTPRAVRGRRAAAVAALGSACLALAAARCSMGSSLRAAAAEARVLAGAAALLGALAALEGWVRGPAVFFVAAVPPATSLSCGLLPFGELDWTLVAFGALAAVASAALVRRRAHALDAAHIQRQRHTEAKQQSVEVLRLMVPEQVIAQLQQGNHQYAERFPSASVFFVEVCGLDEDCGLGPAERLQALNTVFSHFDGVVARMGAYKVETIGKVYMGACGLPEARPDHVQRAVATCLTLLTAARELAEAEGLQLPLKIGMHTGPVVCGVIGLKQPRYRLFGDTVNSAARMESHATPGTLHVSAEVAAKLEASGQYKVVPREKEIEVKGKGLMQTYFVTGLRVSSTDEALSSPSGQATSGRDRSGTLAQHRWDKSNHAVTTVAHLNNLSKGIRSEREKMMPEELSVEALSSSFTMKRPPLMLQSVSLASPTKPTNGSFPSRGESGVAPASFKDVRIRQLLSAKDDENTSWKKSKERRYSVAVASRALESFQMASLEEKNTRAAGGWDAERQRAAVIVADAERQRSAVIVAIAALSAGGLFAAASAHDCDNLGDVIVAAFVAFLACARVGQLAWSARAEESAALALSGETEKVHNDLSRFVDAMLPPVVVRRMRASAEVQAFYFRTTHVFFCDIKGFTKWSAARDATQVIGMLNVLFTSLDAATEEYGVTKIETIGDAYLAATSCLPDDEDGDDSASAATRLARFAIAAVAITEMLRSSSDGAPSEADESDRICIRVGLHTGPCIGGVVGQRMLRYHLFGETVAFTERLESSSEVSAIHCSEAFAAHLRGSFAFRPGRGLTVAGARKVPTEYLLREIEKLREDGCVDKMAKLRRANTFHGHTNQ